MDEKSVKCDKISQSVTCSESSDMQIWMIETERLNHVERWTQK